MEDRRVTGRPRRDLLAAVAVQAGTTQGHAGSFWSRPKVIRPGVKHRIAVAAVELGYKPHPIVTKRHPLPLRGMRFGYEIPRSWDGRASNPVYSATLGELALRLERHGASVVPFVVDPEVREYQHVVDFDSDPEGMQWAETRGDPALQHQAWLRAYAQAIAPDRYLRMWRQGEVNGFFVNDPRADDTRLRALTAEGAPTVLIGRLNSNDPALPSADMDDANGLTEVCRRVLSDGATRVMHLRFTQDGSGPPLRRGRAVRDALGAALLHAEFRDYNDTTGPERIAQAIREHDPHAIVCDSDDFAALAVAAARLARRTVVRSLRDSTNRGRPIVVTGCDDAPVRALSATQWLTLRHNYADWVDNAIKLMVGAVTSTPGPPILLSQHLLLPAGSNRPEALLAANTTDET